MFIGVQSLLAARKTRQLASRKSASQAKEAITPGPAATRRNRQMLLWGGGSIIAIIGLVVAVFAINAAQNAARGSVADTNTPTPISSACQFKPFRQDQAANLLKAGAVLAYERNGGPNCVDELYGIYPDGRIVGDDGTRKIEKQVTPADVDKLLSAISDKGWFTDEMYDTWHTPCEQCYGYYLTVSFKNKAKTVKAVDGGTDAPANYWQVVSTINGVIPHFNSAQ
jgi:hypothetical protein